MYDHVVTSTENHLEIPPDNFKLIFLPIHNPLLGQESFDFSESLMVIVNMLERPTGCGGRGTQRWNEKPIRWACENIAFVLMCNITITRKISADQCKRLTYPFEEMKIPRKMLWQVAFFSSKTTLIQKIRRWNSTRLYLGKITLFDWWRGALSMIGEWAK